MTAGQSQIKCKRRQIHYNSNQLRLEARTSQTGGSVTLNLNIYKQNYWQIMQTSVSNARELKNRQIQ